MIDLPPYLLCTYPHLKIAEKAYRDASVWLFNLSVASRDPPPEQAEITNGRLDELTEKIRDIRYKLR